MVVAASAGGVSALISLLAPLPASFPLPILIAQHLSPSYPSRLPTVLGWRTRLAVKWAEEGERPRSGTVHVCPPNRHLSLSPAGLLAIGDVTGPSRFRPTADLLFESAAAACGARAVGVVLSGMLNDGARGAAAIIAAGGIAMAQCERSAQFFDMPANAIDFGRADLIATPAKLAAYLMLLGETLLPSTDAA